MTCKKHTQAAHVYRDVACTIQHKHAWRPIGTCKLSSASYRQRATIDQSHCHEWVAHSCRLMPSFVGENDEPPAIARVTLTSRSRYAWST